MKIRLLILLFALFALTACGGGSAGNPQDPNPPPPPVGEDGPPLSRKIDPSESKIDPTLSCADLHRYVADAIADQFLNPVFCFNCILEVALDAAQPPELAAGLSAALAAPNEVSGTNVQEAGVDEPDIIKADSAGNLFIADGSAFVIADAFPPTELNEIARIEFDGYIHGLFVSEDAARAIVFMSGFADPTPIVDTALIAPHYGTVVVFLDISDLGAPVETARRWLDGGLRTARRVGERVHMISADYMRTPVAFYQSPVFRDLLNDYQAARAAGDDNRADAIALAIRGFIADEVAAAPLDDYLPASRLSTAGGAFADAAVLACDDIFKPRVSVSLGVTVISSFDLDGGNYTAKGVVVSPHEIYASAENIYLVQQSNTWWWHPLQADETAIHQISIAGGSAEYRASGVVDGRVDGRFNLSEFDGHLRVATNDREWLASTDRVRLSNHLTVLKDDGAGTLRETGAVRGFAPEERIFSARYLGERGFVVTFRLIDPLFTFDLSDPAAPKLVGEVEIPGFSTYMHPYDDRHLITIGQDGNDGGAIRRVRLQLFDVSNLEDPRLLHAHVPGFGDIVPDSSWSPASYDPRAFTFLKSEDLLSLPIAIYDSGNQQSFNGFVAFDVNPDTGFTERSRVDHTDIARYEICDDTPTVPAICESAFFGVDAAPLRTVVMTDTSDAYLYSLSNIAVKATQVDDGESALGVLLLLP